MLRLFYGDDIPEDRRNAYAGMLVSMLAFAVVAVTGMALLYMYLSCAI